MSYENDQKIKRAQRKRLDEMLSARGIKLKIDGCGCCESPKVRVKIGDEDVVYLDYKGERDVQEYFRYSNFNDDDDFYKWE